MRRLGLWTTFVILSLGLSSAATGDANQAEKIFIELLTNPEKGQSHTLREEDLNAYISRELGRKPLRGIEKLTVKLNDGTFTTDATVNLEDVEFSNYLEYMKSLITGPQQLTLEGVLEISEGVGTYRTQAAWLNGIPLPASFVDTLLSTLGRRQNPPFDPTEAFEAPFGINHLEIKPGNAILSK